jgi:hypothetical protein
MADRKIRDAISVCHFSVCHFSVCHFSVCHFSVCHFSVCWVLVAGTTISAEDCFQPRSVIRNPQSLDFLRHYEWGAVFVTQHSVGLRVFDDLLFNWIEFDRTSGSI